MVSVIKGLQDDAAQRVRDFLRDSIPFEQRKWVVDEVPAKWNINKHPLIVVSSNGTPVSTPSHAVEVVHISVRAGSRPLARRICAEVDALISAPSPRSILRGFGVKSRATGIVVAPDSLRGGYAASVSLNILVRRI